MVATVAGTVVCSSPVFLVGAVAVQIRESLHFGAGTLGAVIALYYLGAGLSSIALGRAVEAIGGLRTMRYAGAASSLTLLLIAAVVRSPGSLAAVMVPAGIASAAMQPASNLLLTRRVPGERLGLAFGLKQSAVPFASLLGGLAVPAVALTVGWRWAFAAAAALAAATVLLIPRPRQTLAERRAGRASRVRSPIRRGPLVALTLAFGVGVGAASALTAFLVSSAVAGGLGRGEAGFLAAFGGATAVVSRVVTGLRADRRGRGHLPVVAAMLAVGAAGYAVLSVVSAHRLVDLYFPVVAVVFGAGWGWNGLFNFAVVRINADHPATATGVTQTGGRFGSVVGPLVFGLIVAHGSYSLAWLFTAVAALLSAGGMLAGRRYLRVSGTPAHP